MTLLLDPQSLDHADAVSGGTLRATGGELFDVASEDMLRSGLSVSEREAEFEIVQDQFERARKLGLTLPDRPAAAGLATGRDLSAEELRRRRAARPLGGAGAELGGRGQADRARRAYDRLVVQANLAVAPGEAKFLSLGQVREEALRRARAARLKREEVASRGSGGIGAFFSELGGDVLTSFADPINILASLGAAPALARGFLRAVAVEAGVNFSAEAVIQTTVVPWLVDQGVPRERALTMAAANVVGAMVLGGLLGGGFNIGARATRSIVRAVKAGRPGLFVDAVIEATRPHRATLPEEGLGAVDALGEARAAERGQPYVAPTPEAAAAHAANLDAAVAAVREGRIPDVANRAAFATKTAFVRPVDVEATRVTIGPVRERGFQAEVERFRELQAAARPAAAPGDFRPTPEQLAAADILRGRPAGPAPERLSQFIRLLGGLDPRDQFAGDLRAAGITPRSQPRLFRTRGKGGKPIDEARRAALEASFFPEFRDDLVVSGPTARPGEMRPGDFVEALIEDLRGGRARVRDTDIEDTAARAALAQLQGFFADELGLDLERLTARDLAFLLSQDVPTQRRLALEARVDALTGEESLELASLLSREHATALEDDLARAVEAQRLESFDPDVDADPAAVARLATERPPALDEMEALHAEFQRALEAGRAARPLDRGPGRDGRVAAQPGQRPGEPQRPAQAAQAVPGARGASGQPRRPLELAQAIARGEAVDFEAELDRLVGPPVGEAPVQTFLLGQPGVRLFQFQANRPGGQRAGNQQIIVPLTEDLYDRFVRQLGDADRSFKEFQELLREQGESGALHAQFVRRADDGDFELSLVRSGDVLFEQEGLKRFAIEVQDFNSPEARRVRASFDDDVSAAKAARPTVEATAQGEQTVLPGAERISDRELAERRGAAPLRAGVAQQDLDVGLFGQGAAQLDIQDVLIGGTPSQSVAVRFGTTLEDLAQTAPRADEARVAASEATAADASARADAERATVGELDDAVLDTVPMERPDGTVGTAREFLEESDAKDEGAKAVLDCIGAGGGTTGGES